MKTKKPVPPEKKLTVIARVEPGSLGPDGVDKAEAFCRFANQHMAEFQREFTKWQIIPRYDKTKPEMEFYIQHKKLNPAQVVKYLSLFDLEQDQFEEKFYADLTTLIERFLDLD